MPHKLVVIAGENTAVVFHVVKFLIQDLVNQRALARAACTRHADELAQRDRDVEVIEIVFASAGDQDLFADWFATNHGNFDIFDAF